MSRQINLADNKGRNAEVIFKSFTKKPLVKTVTPKGEATHTVRVLKSVAENSYEYLLKTKGGDEAVAQALITSDPEFDVSMTGLFVDETSKVYINADLKPVFRIQKTEGVYLPDGSLKEERTPKETIANILAEHPIKPAGKLLPIKEVYNKFVFSKKYQLSHVNGLTFDFLYQLSKELDEKKSLMLIGSGEKGVGPLVFQNGGKAYRAFLEGRIKDNGYLLILHLSNLELKSAIAQ